MIWIDYALIGLITIFSLSGFLRGFARVTFSVIIWILATLIGLIFSPDLSIFLAVKIAAPILQLVAAFVLLFLITLMFGALFRILFGGFASERVGFISRLFGLCFGAVHGVFAGTLIVMLAGLSTLPQAPWWLESKLLPRFQSNVSWINNHIPSELANHVRYQ